MPFVCFLHFDGLEEIRLITWIFPNPRALSMTFSQRQLYGGKDTKPLFDALAQPRIPQLTAIPLRCVTENMRGEGYRRYRTLLSGATAQACAA